MNQINPFLIEWGSISTSSLIDYWIFNSLTFAKATLSNEVRLARAISTLIGIFFTSFLPIFPSSGL